MGTGRGAGVVRREATHKTSGEEAIRASAPQGTAAFSWETDVDRTYTV